MPSTRAVVDEILMVNPAKQWLKKQKVAQHKNCISCDEVYSYDERGD
jgi:peptide deformylase